MDEQVHHWMYVKFYPKISINEEKGKKTLNFTCTVQVSLISFFEYAQDETMPFSRLNVNQTVGNGDLSENEKNSTQSYY